MARYPRLSRGVGSFLGAAALLLTPSAPAAAAEDGYYVVVWGAQRPALRVPRRTHSWATFVHAGCDGSFETFTISWLPVSGKVRPLAAHAEPGRNYTLEETLAFCADQRLEVAVWGPYQADPVLWEAGLRQKARLESGAVLYKACDLGASGPRVSNCIHAVEQVARLLQPGGPYVIVAPANWGESGSYWLALTLRPWLPDPCQTHPWVLERLGLDGRAFRPRNLERNPARGPAVRLAQAALQAHLLPNRVPCGH